MSEPAAWRRASRSGSKGNCVEVRVHQRTAAVRDSKDPGERLLVPRQEWLCFLSGIKSGRYDGPRA